MPKPNVNVSRSRVVIDRSAGTVSASGPSGLTSTRRSASSGSRPSTGSSRPSSPSSITARAAAPVIGLVVEAIRKSESRATGGPPSARLPSASTCTSSPRAASTTSPGTDITDVPLGGLAQPFQSCRRQPGRRTHHLASSPYLPRARRPARSVPPPRPPTDATPAPNGGVVRYRPAAVTTLCDHRQGSVHGLRPTRAPTRRSVSPANKRVMEHERPAEMGSVIVFQAHTRNGMCGRFRH